MSQLPPPADQPIIPAPIPQVIAATPGQPTWSPDGKWWWNGQQWMPAPPSGSTSPLQVTQVSGGNPFFSGFMGCLGVGAALVILLIGGLVVFSICMSAALSGAGSTPTP